MSISNLLRSSFAADVRSRGAQYFNAGSVRISNGQPCAVWASVKGSQRYDVAMVLEDSDLFVSCSCPYFQGAGCCKHVATILAADTHGYLNELGRLRKFTIQYGDVDDDYESDFGEFEEDADETEDEDWPEPPRPTITSAKKSKAPKAPKPAAWSRVFQEIKQSLQSNTHQTRAAAWPANRRLLYVIDGPSSQSPGGMALDLGFQDKKKDGNWTKPKFQHIPVVQAESISNEVDPPILALLYGAQRIDTYYGNAYNGGATRFYLSRTMPRDSAARGATGLLFFRPGWVKDELWPIA